MFIKLFTVFLVVVIGLIVALIVFFAEESSEKLFPVLFVGGVVLYVFFSWYLGYFLGTQKPPQILISAALAGIVIAFLSGYFMGR